MVGKLFFNFGYKILALNDNFNCGIVIVILTFGKIFRISLKI